MSGGPILEIGRAAGGSTVILLGASGQRPVVSIDRDPFTSPMAARVFERPDVRQRLTLLTQSSQEPIAANAFGMMFVDGDHSYEGVCHDIAMYWNILKPFDGKPPVAVFHDAAANPISISETVKRAADELLAERGTAKLLESWGSMLLLEKTGGLDQGRWFAKDDQALWRSYPGGTAALRRSGTGHASAPDPTPAVTRGTTNLIGGVNLDDPSWIKVGVALEPIHDHADNPVRWARETAQHGRHGIEKWAEVARPRLIATFFLRPLGRRALRIAIHDAGSALLIQADFEFADGGRIARPATRGGAELVDAAVDYRNGYFCCEPAAAMPSPRRVAIAAHSLSDSGEVEFAGDPSRGFAINLASLRTAT